MRFSSFMKTTAVLGIAAAGQLSASFNDCCNWDWCECPGDFTVFAEALYWKPTHCPVPYARSARTGTVREFLIKNDYQWGVRAGVGYTNDCFLADISYLWIRPTDAASVSPVTTIQGDQIATKAESHLKTRYQNVDLRFGQYLMRRPGCDFYVYGNARWVDLRFKNNTKGTGGTATPVRYIQESKFDGGGLGVGFGGCFEICGGFGVAGRFGFMAIIGDSQLKQQAVKSETTTLANLLQPSRTTIVPEAEFRLGLNYTYECGCWNVLGEIGYEFNYYLEPFRFSTTHETNASLPLVTCQNFGIGGLYLRLAVGF